MFSITVDAVAELDDAVLEAAVLDAVVLEAAVIDAALFDAAVLDAAELEAAELEAAELEVAVLEATELEVWIRTNQYAGVQDYRVERLTGSDIAVPKAEVGSDGSVEEEADTTILGVLIGRLEGIASGVVVVVVGAAEDEGHEGGLTSRQTGVPLFI
jgi:hypothetical protein